MSVVDGKNFRFIDTYSDALMNRKRAHCGDIQFERIMEIAQNVLWTDMLTNTISLAKPSSLCVY